MADWTAGGRPVTREDYLTLTRALEFGDDTPPDCPAAHPLDLIDPLTEWRDAASEHHDCPVWCDDCDQWEAPMSCTQCHGSGCGPGTASGAYSPCDYCAGEGRDHRPYTPTGTWRHQPHDPAYSHDRAVPPVVVRRGRETHPDTMIGRP